MPQTSFLTWWNSGSFFYCCCCFLAVLGFEFRASGLHSRCSTAWAILLALENQLHSKFVSLLVHHISLVVFERRPLTTSWFNFWSEVLKRNYDQNLKVLIIKSWKAQFTQGRKHLKLFSWYMWSPVLNRKLGKITNDSI
jgi:hypothetical protein